MTYTCTYAISDTMTLSDFSLTLLYEGGTYELVASL